MEDLVLTEEEKKDLKLSSLNGGGYCQNCRDCVGQCPANVEIPSLMRAVMYAEGYGNLSQAEFTLGILPEDRGLAACRGCSVCRVDCRNGMQVDHNVKTLKKQFYYSERFIS
jgi:predicted aldo/keto reductase-like oxidoreductase